MGFRSTILYGGGPVPLLKNMKFFSLRKWNFLPTHFIVLNWSIGIFRNCQKVSAFNSDPKGVKNGAARSPGPKDPPNPNRVKENLSISPGETKLVATACNITEKLPRLSIYIKAPEKLPLLFESEGYVSHKYRGRIFVRVTNYSPQCVSLPTSTNIGYLLVQKSSL